MAFARHGGGLREDLAALLSQVHPVFMLPPIAASWFGSVLAGTFSLSLGALHMTAIFAAVYTAHVKDGYVDFYLRGEDSDHPLSKAGCKRALVGASALFFACLAGLWYLVDLPAALLTLPTWLIAYHHAPQLDTNPITTTTGYPTGIALAILGGFYVQAGTLEPIALAFSLVFLVLLSGVKVIDDQQDYAYDRSIEKRTVAVALGPARARSAAYGLMALALALVVGFALLRVFPPETVLAVAAFGVVAAISRRADSEIATMLLVRGAYVFLALLLAAVWFRPL
ncbi:1,4-dihydroxy-2-naphthoate octaprenyltransferase [Halalkalicoccus paucihalophilus]|uniref:1,4-dihydroxy-2-naphthoate octaprenyltransferase n=1 Tax=Halalkalicoccus paucihalophilus TaxID=1008153 RepID=A0A151AI77_9EURY|nr:UbiA family prenyltransferase [Halalkalicoccus paucihalophilus]KYH27369.1 1,4-dihydroxy-2-naphthoate octaprenyltransferase [Halalkalicoccus paucihalophilus]